LAHRDRAPVGAPCWADLSTSETDGSRRFHGELLGWESQEPNPEFGGYSVLTRDGLPIAGAYGGMGGSADDAWRVYLASADADATVAATAA